MNFLYLQWERVRCRPGHMWNQRMFAEDAEVKQTCREPTRTCRGPCRFSHAGDSGAGWGLDLSQKAQVDWEKLSYWEITILFMANIAISACGQTEFFFFFESRSKLWCILSTISQYYDNSLSSPSMNAKYVPFGRYYNIVLLWPPLNAKPVLFGWFL
jgi:hypothetical protein